MVHIVGAGPGDPELITVKGHKLLSEADVVIYAGSLINPEILKICKPDADIYNSAEMTLEEVINVIKKAESDGKMTVRLHTGDPSIYGAIQEQMDELDELKIEFDIVPGVSSFLAAAAALRKEYTLPGITQTIILTRRGGVTPVPDKESLKKLGQSQATICIFLSISSIKEVVRDLMSAGYKSLTPAAVVYKATWEDEKIIRGTLSTIAEQVKVEGIGRTAIIIVGQCLSTQKGNYAQSQLYSPQFSHMFRTAKL
ncbi:MAG: precorrin-4 C(11)-methyltransferase [Selenomonadaceae bacterium]|nr:precorrin-4 C(11)-methyltransferase [Selenomonadaceae bacterium]